MCQFTRVTTDVLERLRELVDGGRLKVALAKQFTLAQSREAFNLAEAGRPTGKVVFEIKG